MRTAAVGNDNAIGTGDSHPLKGFFISQNTEETLYKSQQQSSSTTTTMTKAITTNNNKA